MGGDKSEALACLFGIQPHPHWTEPLSYCLSSYAMSVGLARKANWPLGQSEALGAIPLGGARRLKNRTGTCADAHPLLGDSQASNDRVCENGRLGYQSGRGARRKGAA